MMYIGLIGVDHTQAKILSFEPIFLNKEGKQHFRLATKEQSPLHECVILTTCNRIEFYYCADNQEEAEQWILNRIVHQKNVDMSIAKSLLKPYDNHFVIQHLFEVASGVQSMVFGENEILTQVKEAYENAYVDGTTGAYLNKCFQTAVAVGKRSRSETEISRGAYSVSSIAVDALRQERLDYFGCSILIIGCGTMGKRCLKKLVALGHPDISICNRNAALSLQLSKEHHVKQLSLDKAIQRVANYDVVISAVAVKDALLTPENVSSTASTLWIDLGLPRNIDPLVSSSIITVEDLKKIAKASVKRRKGEERKVHLIIDEEKERLSRWFENKKSHAH